MINALTTLLSPINTIVKTVFGSTEQRDKDSATSLASAQSQFASEFGHSKNWFDSLIDGINRLPRPTFAFGTLYLFVMCWNDPDKFREGAYNLSLVPQEMWYILGAIVTFFFGGRIAKDFGNNATKSLTKVVAPKPVKHEDTDWGEKVSARYKVND